MRCVANDTADHRSQPGQPHEKPGVETQQPAMRHPQTAHDGTGIEMALHITSRSSRNGHSRKNHRQYRGKTQKALGAIKRTANFRPCVACIFQSLAAAQSF